MTRQQAAWATKHDWCLKAICVNGHQNEWLALVEDEELPQGSRVFTDFLDLYVWAGY